MSAWSASAGSSVAGLCEAGLTEAGYRSRLRRLTFRLKLADGDGKGPNRPLDYGLDPIVRGLLAKPDSERGRRLLQVLVRPVPAEPEHGHVPLHGPVGVNVLVVAVVG